MRLLPTLLVLMLCCIPPALAEEGQPIAVRQSDKCPVCGMFVVKYPDFLARVSFEDDTYAFFDGNKDMFKYLFALAKYNPAQKDGTIREILVTDYYGMHRIDGRRAWFVAGSDVYSPMGRELISFEQEAEAAEFARDHHGKKILRFDKIDKEVVGSLE